MKNTENAYIKKRKFKAFLHSLPYALCNIFPVKNKKVVMWTFEGIGGYCDSPKYIADELLKRNKNSSDKYSIVWLVNDTAKEFPDDITVVKNTLWKRAYHLSTANYWVSNTRTFYGTRKRKKTVYYQTWHSIGGIKPIGLQRGSKFSKIAELVSKADSKLINYVLSGNEWSNRTLPDGLIYDGEIIQTGVPRCDILINDKTAVRKEIRSKYGLNEDTNIVLYAPTFRGGNQGTKRTIDVGNVNLDFEKLLETLEKKFYGNWVVFLRLHPQLTDFLDKMPVAADSKKIIDVSKHTDMNELIASSDILITDYSSTVFESALMKQPVFLYIYDKEEYIKGRGDLMFNIEELPFPSASDMSELLNIINKFDKQKYINDIDSFLDELGNFEDGHSSKRVVDFMEKH